MSITDPLHPDRVLDYVHGYGTASEDQYQALYDREQKAQARLADLEARIEKEAELFDARAILNEQGMEQPLPSSSVARLLRSLLTGVAA